MFHPNKGYNKIITVLIGLILVLGIAVMYYAGYFIAKEKYSNETSSGLIKTLISTTTSIHVIQTTTTSTTITTTTTIPSTTTSVSTTTIPPVIIYLEPDKKAASTPTEDLSNQKDNNAGRYFINQTVTFDRKTASGIIPGQMIEIQLEDLNNTILKTNETIFNIYLLRWNGTLEDVTTNYSNIIKH